MNTIVEKYKIETADFLLARLGAIPSSYMQKLLLSESSKVLGELNDKKEMVEKIKYRVIDILYEAVPKIGDNKHVLRATIKLKRNIFNNRKVNINQALLEDLYTYFSNKDKAVLKEWFSLYKDIERLTATYERKYDEEIDAINEEMIRFWKDMKSEDLMKGIVLASEEFANAMFKNKKDLRKYRTNLSKTAFRYLQRSTVKTSPFSTFTQLAHVSLSESKFVSEETSRNHVKINRAIVSSIAETIALAYKDHFPFMFNTVVDIDGQPYFTNSVYTNMDGFFWKMEDVVKNTSIIKVYQSLPIAFQIEPFYLEDLKKELGTNQGHYIVKILLSTKILRPIIPGEAYRERVFNKIASYMQQQGVQNDKLFDLLREMDELVSQLGEYECSPKTRLILSKKFKKHVKEIFQLLHVQEPNWLTETNVLYEDVRSDVSHIQLPSNIKEQLQKIHEKIQLNIKVSPMYTKIVNYFLNKYGENNRCQLLSFIFTIYSNQKTYMQMLNETQQQIIDEQDQSKNDQILGKTMAKKTSTIYFQLIPGNNPDDYNVVVNKVSTGTGNIFARFVPLLDEKYRQNLKNWIQNTFPADEVVEFSPGEDWSNLQENFGVLEKVMKDVAELPFEQRDKKTIDINSLYIEYNQSTGTLDILDQNGNGITPVYLGTIPQYLFRSPVGILLSLINPWVVDTDIGINSRPWEEQDKEVESIEYIPRMQEGKIIYKRAKWLIPYQYIPLKEKLETYAGYYQRAHKFLKSHDIPAETYLKVVHNGINSMNQKPLWMHFDSPYCIDMLNKTVDKTVNYIVLTEALPSSQHSFIRNEQGDAFVSEFMSLNRSEYCYE